MEVCTGKEWKIRNQASPSPTGWANRGHPGPRDQPLTPIQGKLLVFAVRLITDRVRTTRSENASDRLIFRFNRHCQNSHTVTSGFCVKVLHASRTVSHHRRQLAVAGRSAHRRHPVRRKTSERRSLGVRSVQLEARSVRRRFHEVRGHRRGRA